MSKYFFVRFSVLLILLLLFAACGNAVSSSSSASTNGNVAAATPTIIQQPGTFPALMATGNIHEYPLPQAQSGLMRPVVDHKGRVWFGEMGRNYLAVFDPRTQTFQQMKPPRGANGIMGIAVAADDSIWFAEQYANYIGHYFPNTHTFQVYNLPTLTTPDPSDAHKTLTLPLAPNDITLDAHGNIWFTELNADSLGMLDVKNRQFKHYPLTPQKSVQTLDPYGIAIDPAGRVWFTESSTPRIGYLDPQTGKVHFFNTHTPGRKHQPLSLLRSSHARQPAVWHSRRSEAYSMVY